MVKNQQTERSQNFKKQNQPHTRNNVTTQTLLQKYTYTFTRDAEWFKKTMDKVEQVKEEMDSKFYSEEKKRQKVDFIRKMKTKLKDYKDAIKFQEVYRKVKFFERRKLERSLKKIGKEIDLAKSENKDTTQLEENKIKIVSDINYVKYYPKTYKYYSLFPNKDQENPETKKKIEKMRKKIDFYLNNISKKRKYEKTDEDKDDKDKNTNDYEKEAAKRFKRESKIEEDDFFVVDE
jgi:hypothetical protein